MVKNLPANAGDMGSIPGSGRSLGEGNGDPLQHSCLENSMDRGDWRITDHGVPKSGTQLSTLTHMCVCVCVFLFFLIFFSIIGLLYDIDYSSLCYTVGPC